MKAIEQARETIKRLRNHVMSANQEAKRITSLLSNIPKNGRWTPLNVKRNDVFRINGAVKLKIGRAYVVKNKHGQALSLWADMGWEQINDQMALPCLTHVWMPVKNK